MFEFEIRISCPHCGHEIYTSATYNNEMEPLKDTEQCFECEESFSVTPPTISVDGYDCSVIRINKSKTD